MLLQTQQEATNALQLSTETMAQQGNEPKPVKEFSNNAVARSDYEVAIQAIESTFADFVAGDMEIPEGLDRERIAEIYQEAKVSMLRNMERLVQPTDDNDFHDYVEQYHYVLEEYDDDDIKEELQLPPIQDEEEDEEEEEEEDIDEEELVDQRAWNDAQNLRSRIRTMSHSVQGVRERILKQSEDDLVTSLDRHLIDGEVKFVEDVAFNEDSVPVLQESLQALSKVLQDPQWSKLPHHIQSLQDTIDAIQKETSEDRPMSQTEFAILSQNSESEGSVVEASRKLLEESTDNIEASMVTAMDRLAMLGQCF